MYKNYAKRIEIKQLIDWISAFYGDNGSDFLEEYKEERLEAYQNDLDTFLNFLQQYKDDCVDGKYGQRYAA